MSSHALIPARVSFHAPAWWHDRIWRWPQMRLPLAVAATRCADGAFRHTVHGLRLARRRSEARRRRTARLALRASRAARAERAAHLAVLQRELDAHLMLNIMTSAAVVMRGGRTDAAVAMLARTGDLLRCSLEQSAPLVQPDTPTLSTSVR